jgi:hypothetical protein
MVLNKHPDKLEAPKACCQMQCGPTLDALGIHVYTELK